MILGIGSDMCDARRMVAAMERHPDRFVQRIFTASEIQHAAKQADASLFYAKRFAAKEAIYKALSASGVAGLGWQDAEILNDQRGAPTVALSGACKRALERLTPDGYKASVWLSLSDEPPYGLAYVVVSAGTISG